MCVGYIQYIYIYIYIYEYTEDTYKKIKKKYFKPIKYIVKMLKKLLVFFSNLYNTSFEWKQLKIPVKLISQFSLKNTLLVIKKLQIYQYKGKKQGKWNKYCWSYDNDLCMILVIEALMHNIKLRSPMNISTT